MGTGGAAPLEPPESCTGYYAPNHPIWQPHFEANFLTSSQNAPPPTKQRAIPPLRPPNRHSRFYRHSGASRNLPFAPLRLCVNPNPIPSIPFIHAINPPSRTSCPSVSEKCQNSPKFLPQNDANPLALPIFCAMIDLSGTPIRFHRPPGRTVIQYKSCPGNDGCGPTNRGGPTLGRAQGYQRLVLGRNFSRANYPTRKKPLDRRAGNDLEPVKKEPRTR